MTSVVHSRIQKDYEIFWWSWLIQLSMIVIFLDPAEAIFHQDLLGLHDLNFFLAFRHIRCLPRYYSKISVVERSKYMLSQRMLHDKE